MPDFQSPYMLGEDCATCLVSPFRHLPALFNPETSILIQKRPLPHCTDWFVGTVPKLVLAAKWLVSIIRHYKIRVTCTVSGSGQSGPRLCK